MIRTMRTLWDPIYEGPRDPGVSASKWGAKLGFAPLGKYYLYQFFNRSGSLLYVGITCQPQNRWSVHSRKAWWSDVSRVEVYDMDSKWEAADCERWVIKTNDPIHNIAQKLGGR